MAKNKALRNVIIGITVGVLVVCIAIPTFSALFPWIAKGGDDTAPASETYTVAPVETGTEATSPETDGETAPPYSEDTQTAAATQDTQVATTSAATSGTTSTTKAPTTTKKVTTTKAPTTTKATTTKPTTTQAPTTTPAEIINGGTVVSDGGQTAGGSHVDGAVKAPADGEDDPREVLSYKMNAVDGYFYTEQEAWQRAFGFAKLYDWGAQWAHMFYDTIRIQFTYGGYDWMIQFWKGQYGYMFLGSEIGVYYLPEGKGYNPLREKNGFGASQAIYKCVPNEDMLNMSTALFNYDVFQAKRPYKPYWWCTAFVPGTLDKAGDRSQLRIELVIEMKDNEMGDAFEQALLYNGFKLSSKSYADCIKNGFDGDDVYARSGTRFAINWHYLRVK
ncbi:MAG: DUF4474 domain-containing protein [Clostridium sp.]|nr:DUF4474 domain-containing protein [Clostridium sp.]